MHYHRKILIPWVSSLSEVRQVEREKYKSDFLHTKNAILLLLGNAHNSQLGNIKYECFNS